METEILLAQPRGFCAGVDRAIEIVERALTLFGAPIYVRHEIVHNAYVVNSLREKGAVFIEDLEDVPAGSTLIFRHMECPNLFELMQKKEVSKSLMRPVPWLPKCIWKLQKCARKVVRL